MGNQPRNLTTLQISTHAGTTIAHQGGSFEPQRKAHFALVIAGLPDTEKLVLSLQSLKIPALTLSSQSIKYFNDSVKYIGALEPFQDGTISFRDFIDVDILGVLSRWFKQGYNPQTGGVGWARDYKKTAEVYLLPPSTPNAAAPGAVTTAPFKNRLYRLQGVYISSLDYPELDHNTSGEQSVISVTLSVDRAIPAQMGNIS